uniref:Secreted protein n=1 Tax=Steinernema glaseri TaxID=37863 RepID=A0A1I7Z2T3_9BILA
MMSLFRIHLLKDCCILIRILSPSLPSSSHKIHIDSPRRRGRRGVTATKRSPAELWPSYVTATITKHTQEHGMSQFQEGAGINKIVLSFLFALLCFSILVTQIIPQRI